MAQRRALCREGGWGGGVDRRLKTRVVRQQQTQGSMRITSHAPHGWLRDELASGGRTLVDLGSCSKVVAQVDRVQHRLNATDGCRVQLSVLGHRELQACLGHLRVGEEKVLKLAQQRLAVIRRPFDSGRKGGRWHGNVRMRRVMSVEEGSEGHVRELAVATIRHNSKKLLQNFGRAFTCAASRYIA